jgi:Ca-activated chloride channel family protein
MALDISASMAGAIADVRTSARTFIGALREQDALTILGFNDNIFTVARRESRPEARLKALDRLAPWGATSLYDVISRGVTLLRQQPGRKGLVVFSDGDDESSRLTFDAVEKELQSSDAVMYAVGLGRGAHMADLTRQLSRLSDASGGRAVIAPDTSELSDAFGDVVAELSHQYVLSYAPTNDKRDGAWRTLTVEVPGKDVRLRARQGYRARGATP